MGIQSNSWRVVNCLIILLTDSAVEMRVAGTVMDSVMTLLSLSLRSASRFISNQIAEFTGSMLLRA